jgi:hypothetical protein
MIWYKEKCKKLVNEQATVKVTIGTNVYERKAVKTFASRAGRSSYWGVVFDKPTPDGCTGAVFSELLIR